MQAEQNPLIARVGPGTADKAIEHERHRLLGAIETAQAGGRPPMDPTPDVAGALTGPDTIKGIAPAQGWERFRVDRARAQRDAAGWLAAVVAIAAAATTAEAAS